MRRKFLINLNSLFPLSYKLFEEDYDKTYLKLREDLKVSWLSTQHSFLNGVTPIIALFISFSSIICLNLVKIISLQRLSLFLICSLFFWFTLWILLNFYQWDKYLNKKYLELSK
jgi:hypothetical protein